MVTQSTPLLSSPQPYVALLMSLAVRSTASPPLLLILSVKLKQSLPARYSMDWSRKRTLSDTAEQPPFTRARSTADDCPTPQHAKKASALDSPETHLRDAQIYSDINASGSSRNHLGDNYVINNYGAHQTSEEQNALWRVRLEETRRFEEEQSQRRKEQEEEQEGERRLKDFMDVLAFERMHSRRAAIDAAYGETCQWIFKQEEYLRWSDASARRLHHGFFWIKGKPGSGKSTLMRCILERLQHHQRDIAVVSYFFNARGGPLERSIEGFYRSLLYQTLDQYPNLIPTADLPPRLSARHSWEVSVLQGLFRQTILKLRGQHLVLLIDALDEGDEDEVRDMVDLVSTLTQSVETLQVCFASRHYPSISLQSCEELWLENSTSHDQDIVNFVLQKLRFRTEQEKTDLVSHVTHKARGVFLWTVLVVRILNKHIDRGWPHAQLLATIDAIPDALDALYDKILSDGDSDMYLLPTLLWILAGHRAMTIRELYVGILFGANDKDLPPDDVVTVNETTMTQFIVQSSRGLVEAVREPRNRFQHGHHPFQFIHESVRQFILLGKLATIDSKFSGDIVSGAHAILAQWCQSYVPLRLSTTTFSVVANYPQVDCNPARPDRLAYGALLQKAAPFLSYAFSHMFYHLRSAYRQEPHSLEMLRNFPIRNWITLYNLYLDQDRFLSPSTGLLYFMLEAQKDENPDQSFQDFFKTLIDCNPIRPDTAQHDSGTTYATRAQVQIILTGQGLNAHCGGRFGTILVAAASLDLNEIVQAVLDCGADPNIGSNGIGLLTETKGKGALPLTAAVRHIVKSKTGARSSTIETLLDHGAEINARNGDALLAAVLEGDTDVATLLIRRGADLHLMDPAGFNTMLKRSFERPHNGEITSLLLDSGACENSKMAGVFLYDAAKQGNFGTFIRLLHLGADARSRDADGRTTLHALCEGNRSSNSEVIRDCIKTARYLLDLGVDLDAIGGEYDTALIAAAMKGLYYLIPLFLNQGVNVHHRNRRHGTAIEAAQSSGFGNIVHMISSAHGTVRSIDYAYQEQSHFRTMKYDEQGHTNDIKYAAA